MAAPLQLAAAADGSPVSFSSTLPAIVPEPVFNPQFVYTGQPVPMDATVAGEPTGTPATCVFRMVDPDDLTEFTAPVTDGHCKATGTPFTTVGRHSWSVMLMNESGNQAANSSLSINVVDPLPPPELVVSDGLTTGIPVVGDVDAGAPNGYTITAAAVVPTAAFGRTAVPGSTVTTAAPTVIASGSLDPRNRSGQASATWRPTAGGDYIVSMTFKDVLGRQRTTTKRVHVSVPQPPRVSLPAASLIVGSKPSLTSLPMHLGWTGTAGTSPLSSYKLQVKSPSATTYVAVPLAAPLATTKDTAAAPGGSTIFRVQVVDKTNAASGWQSAAVLPAVINDGAPAITYVGTWSAPSLAGALGGAVHATTRNGASAQLTTTARSIGIVTTMGPNRGKLSVSIDGAAPVLIDLYSPTLKTVQLLFVRNFAAAASHTVKVTSVTTAVRPRVDIDAFVTLR
jgi:hypothetical protein